MYENERKKFSREHMWYCEIVVDGQTYRFCEDISPIPAGLNVEAASMSTPTITPAQINLDGGIGVRASASLSFASHLDYTRFGSITEPVRFWPRWRAVHRGYEGASISLFSGYIVDGKFSADNFRRSDFILDSFGHNESGARISAKDVLKLASNDQAKAPRLSNGAISVDITESTTSITLTPSGVGNSEYPSSGKGRIGDEVVSFTRSGDNFTLTRGQNNTVADEHSEGDLFQLCLFYNASISDIIADLLQTYAGVPSSQIPKSAWDSESDIHFPNLYEALITEPTGVRDLLKELGELGCYLFFSERTNEINLVAIKAPPSTATTLTAESNLLEGSTNIVDAPEMRISTVIVNFGIFDPTKDLDEVSNYRQGHIRFNPAAVARYNGVEKYKVINSRWISNENRASAVRLAARKGRRFEDIPRAVKFALDSKDSGISTGSTAFVNSDLIVDESGNRLDLPVQILSATEGKGRHSYSALEFSYGVELDDDLGSEDENQRLVILSGDLTNVNLRSIYNTLFPDVVSTYNVLFVIDASCVIGSVLNTDYAMDTGSWPELTANNLALDIRGFVVGKGGDGENISAGAATAGGSAIILNTDVDITNTGVIGGGGGGGGKEDQGVAEAAGGGGAGFNVGIAGTGSFAINETRSSSAENGTLESGGNGATAEGEITEFEPVSVEGGRGGDLGQSGFVGGGNAGNAIVRNGNTATFLVTGDIRGAIL